MRSNGLPTYQLSVVVDDIDMRITHVVRGADHLSNTPKQVLIYRALGVEPPIFAHVPLILGPDRTRLSKRHGATSVGSYAEEGFLPEAFRNFLALLGWSPGNDDEFIRTSELIERFSLAGVSRTNAIFDRAKLEWFNTQYLQKVPVDETPSLYRSGAQARRNLAGILGRRGSPMVRARRRSDPAAHALPRRFHHLVARLLHRRFRLRRGSESQVLERRAHSRLAREANRRAGRAPRMESRRMRRGRPRRRRRRRRKSRRADQRHARSHRRPRSGSSAFRDDGRARQGESNLALAARPSVVRVSVKWQAAPSRRSPLPRYFSDASIPSPKPVPWERQSPDWRCFLTSSA